jgi:hypothetical protein
MYLHCVFALCGFSFARLCGLFCLHCVEYSIVYLNFNAIQVGATKGWRTEGSGRRCTAHGNLSLVLLVCLGT